MSDSDVDSSSLPPPPPPLPHSNSPKAHGSKTKGSPFEGAIQLPMRPASTTSGRSQAPLTQPSNNSSPVLLSRSSQWSPSSEPSTPPITDSFDPIYGRRRGRCKRWLVGSLTTVAVVIAVVFGIYLAGQRQIFLKHVQEHHHHNETSTTINESLVKSPDSGGEEDIHITSTPQPTETFNGEGVRGNNLNASTPPSTKHEPTSNDSVLSTQDASSNYGTEGKVDLNSNNVSQQRETSNPEGVPDRLSDEDNLVTPETGPNAGTKPIRKTSTLASSKLQGDLMEALMEGNHKTVNQLKRASPNHELTQEEIDASIAREEPPSNVNAQSSEEDEEYSEEERPSEPLELPPAENPNEEGTEAQEYPVESAVENPGYGVLQPSSEDVPDVQISGIEESQTQTNHFQYPSFQGTAEQPIESQELSVGYSTEKTVEKEHNFGDISEYSNGRFPAEHRLSFKGSTEQHPGVPEDPTEHILQEPIEKEHSFGNFREQEVGTQEDAVGHIPAEHRLPFEHTQEQPFGTQGYPDGGSPEQSPETREYPAIGNNKGQSSEEKDLPSGYSSEQAFENSDSIKEPPAESHEYPVGKTYKQSDEIQDSIQGSPEALEPSQYPEVGVQPGHMEGNLPNVAPVPNSPEYSFTHQPDGLVDGFKREYLEEQSPPFVTDNYQQIGSFGENAVPFPGEIFTNEIDSPIIMANRLNFPEQNFVQPAVFGDPYSNQNVPRGASLINSNEFDPYRNDVLEPSTKERYEQKPTETVDALYAYHQGEDTSLLDEEQLQNPDESVLPEVGEGHLPSERSPDANVPQLFEGPLLVDDSQEFSGSHMASGETSLEELEDEGTVENQEASGGAPDKLAFSEGPSVFNEGPQVNQYPETRSVPVFPGKLNGEFAGSLYEDDELRTAGLRRSIGNESPYSPFQPRLLSKFSLRERPPILLPHNGLPNQIPTAVPSSLLLPEGTIATPALILETLPDIRQQSSKQASLSSPVSSNPIEIASGSAQNPIPEGLPISLTNLPIQVSSKQLVGVHPSGQLIQLPYLFNNPSIFAKYKEPGLENTLYGLSNVRNANLLERNPKLPLHSAPLTLNSPTNPWYHLSRSGQIHTLLSPYENLPTELYPQEKLQNDLSYENLPDEAPCDENRPDELSHPQNLPTHSLNPPKQILIPHQSFNPAHPVSKLLEAEKVPYHIINSHHRNPQPVGSSKHNSQSIPPFHPALTMRNLHSTVIPKNHPNVKHISEKIYTPSEIERAHEHASQPARNPPWLQSVTLPHTVDTSVLKTLQKLDNLNALNHAASVADSDNSYPSDESSIKYPPLNAFLHGGKHTPFKTPETLPRANALGLMQSSSNYGSHYTDKSYLKHSPLHAFSHSETHIPLLTSQTPHQLKNFAPIGTNSESIYPTDKNYVQYPPPQALLHGGKHTPILQPQNLHQPKSFAPAPNVTPAELPRPLDKSSIVHPSTKAFLHGDKHTPAFLPQTSYKLNTVPHVTYSETACPTDKSSVKYHPLNSFLHDEKHPPASLSQTPRTLNEPFPSKSILSSPVVVEDVSPVETFYRRAPLKPIPQPPFSNFGIKPLAFYETQQPPSSQLDGYEVKQASRLPLAGYPAKQPLPLPLPFYDAKLPPTLPFTIFDAKQPSPFPFPPHDVKLPSPLNLATYDAKPPLPSPLPVCDEKQPTHIPVEIDDTNQPPPLHLPVNDTKQPSSLPLSTYDTHQPPPSPLPVYDEMRSPPLTLPVYDAKQLSPLPLANQPLPIPLPIYDAKKPSPLPWAAYGMKQTSPLPLPVYDANKPSPLFSSTYGVKQPLPLPFYDAKQPALLPFPIHDAIKPFPLPLTFYSAKQPSPATLPINDAQQPPALPFYGANQLYPAPLPAYEQPLALSGANQHPPFSVPSQYTPLAVSDDEDVPRPAPVEHLARPDVAALLKSSNQLGLDRLTALSEPGGILNPCSGEGSSEEPPKPSIMLVSSQPMDKITKPVHPNGKPVLPIQYLPGPYAWKDKNIVYSSNFPDLPIPAALFNGATESTAPSSPLATPFGPSSILSHLVESIPFTWVQPISRVPNQNQFPGLQV